ncbi:hypothetical protein B0H14DRAFT_2598801 [Mycena olivaceomarginata]|nr:hypothetical protein B0H14DRAFT_2632445 [Mycena olivaceomarginata]KAJ7822004.1 hypothetical protein B0H14DRAFT_2598801 [Mycena olivaceomarginata]
MDTCEAVRDSVKIRLYCDTMLIDAVPIEGVEREWEEIRPELRWRFGPCPIDNTVPEVDEVEDAVDVGLGRSSAVAENDAVGVRRDRLNRELSWTRAGGVEVKLYIGSSIEIGSSTGGTDTVTVLKYEWEKVDVDVETDVEGPGAEEGDGWSNFLCFARVTGADEGGDFRTGSWDVLHGGSLGVTTDIIHDTNRRQYKRQMRPSIWEKRCGAGDITTRSVEMVVLITDAPDVGVVMSEIGTVGFRN